MKRYSVAVGGAVTADADDVTVIDTITGTFSSIAKAFGSGGEDDLITVKEQGRSVLIASGISYLFGDYMGHRSAAAGGKAWVSRLTGN